MKSTLAYAYLTTSFNEGAKSPLDVLDKVLIRTLLHRSPIILDHAETQKLVEADWGLSIPINVIRYSLGRLRASGQIEYRTEAESTADTFVFMPRPTALADSKARELQAREKYDRTIKKIRTWLMRDDNPHNLNADEVVEKWLDESALSFLGGKSDAQTAGTLDRAVNQAIVGAGRLLETKPDDEFLSDLGELALGDVLYRSIRDVTENDLNGQSAHDQGTTAAMSGVDVYLDTGVLLRACGYHGKRHTPAALELLQMAKDTGAKLRAFRHTADELSEGIAAVADMLRRRPGDAHGPIAAYAFENHLTPAQLLEKSLASDSKLEELGIEIVEKLPHDIPLTIDELALDRAIKDGVRQENPLARKRDVDSLAAIFRLRQGLGCEKLERCVAILVTNNKSLADTGHKFFRKHFDEEGVKNIVQLCMTDVVMATRLWTKLPTGFKWVPRNQIISYAIANLVPNESIRRQFLDSLQRMLEDEKISEGEALRVRHSRFTDQMLSMQYRGNDKLNFEAVSNIINDVLLRERQKLVAAKQDGYRKGISEAEVNLDQLRKEFSETEQSLTEEARGSLEALQNEIQEAKGRVAILERIVGYIADVVMLLLFVTVWLGGIFGASTFLGAPLGWTTSIVAILSTMLLIYLTWNGMSRKELKALIVSRMMRWASRAII